MLQRTCSLRSILSSLCRSAGISQAGAATAEQPTCSACVAAVGSSSSSSSSATAALNQQQQLWGQQHQHLLLHQLSAAASRSAFRLPHHHQAAAVFQCSAAYHSKARKADRYQPAIEPLSSSETGPSAATATADTTTGSSSSSSSSNSRKHSSSRSNRKSSRHAAHQHRDAPEATISPAAEPSSSSSSQPWPTPAASPSSSESSSSSSSSSSESSSSSSSSRQPWQAPAAGPSTTTTSSSSSNTSSSQPWPPPAASRRARQHKALAAAAQRMETSEAHSSSSSSSTACPQEGPDLTPVSGMLAAAVDRWRTTADTTNSTSNSSSSSSSDDDSSSRDSSSSSSSRGGRAPLSSMLAAAAQRLEASPEAVGTSRHLRALRSGSNGGSSVGSSGSNGGSPEAHKRYSLPPYTADQQQQRMLAKAIAVIDRLRAHGFSAFIAGGWVRDVYLARRAADIDIATSADPYRVRGIFRGDSVKDLPRTTVKLTHQGEVFELSFFKGVSRTSSLFSVGMDAACRDFTINALYYDPATNEVLDFVGGVPDALSRTLRLTNDDPKRLADDPLRVLRAVRFATVLGLKLAPGTALALRQHADMCSMNAGVPPRRIWLELRKLAKAEAQQPGSWPHALKLSFHLGLLPHLFPWLQQQQQHTNNTTSSSSSGKGVQQQQQQQQQSAAVIDPFGYGISIPGSKGSSSNGGGGGVSSGGKAVLVAERLSKLWQQQQQQQDAVGAAEGIPLPLLVAATVHPSAESFAAAEPYLQQLFPDSQDWHTIQALITATHLLKGTTSPDSSSSSSSSGSSSIAGVEGPAAGWAAFYSHPHAWLVLLVLSCWMPEALAAGFLRTHEARMAASRWR